MISFTEESGKAYRVRCRLKIKEYPEDMIGEIEVEQCMVHPQRKHTSLSRRLENVRALRWNKILTAKTAFTQIFMFYRPLP